MRATRIDIETREAAKSTSNFSNSANVIELKPIGAILANIAISAFSPCNPNNLTNPIPIIPPSTKRNTSEPTSSLGFLIIGVNFKPNAIRMTGPTKPAIVDSVMFILCGTVMFANLRVNAATSAHNGGDMKIFFRTNELSGLSLPNLTAIAYTTLKTIRPLNVSMSANLTSPSAPYTFSTKGNKKPVFMILTPIRREPKVFILIESKSVRFNRNVTSIVIPIIVAGSKHNITIDESILTFIIDVKTSAGTPALNVSFSNDEPSSLFKNLSFLRLYPIPNIKNKGRILMIVSSIFTLQYITNLQLVDEGEKGIEL